MEENSKYFFCKFLKKNVCDVKKIVLLLIVVLLSSTSI